MSVFHVPSVSVPTPTHEERMRLDDCASTSTHFAPTPLSEKTSSAWNANSMSASSRPSARCWASCWRASTSMCRRWRLGERRLHRVLKSTESYTTAVGPVKVSAHAVSQRTRTRGGADGASRRHCRRALDATGGASGEPCGGADDAERRARRCCASWATWRRRRVRSGPLAQGVECALGGKPGGVRIGVARGGGGARGGGDGGGLARWGDGSDERREASREARALTRRRAPGEGAGRAIRRQAARRCRSTMARASGSIHCPSRACPSRRRRR